MSTEFAYDPCREAVTNYVRDLRKARADRAARYRRNRSRWRGSLPISVQARNQLVRFGQYHLARADVASLRETARLAWDYANHGLDGYNGPCGHDDYISEKMDYSRSLALEIWRTVGRFG